MNFFIAQMYSVYKKDGALNPEFMVRNYLFVLTFFMLMSILVITIDLVEFFFAYGVLRDYIVLFIGLIAVMTFFTGKFYKRYFSKKRLDGIQHRYKNILPSYLVYILMVILLMLLLLLGPSLSILLTGGEIFGKRFYGILRA